MTRKKNKKKAAYTGALSTKVKVGYIPAAHDDIVKNLCHLGLDLTQIAESFGVKKKTFKRWMKIHPSIQQSISSGGVYADGMVASALYLSAIGGHVVKEQKLTSTGDVVEVTREVPPSFSAQKHWLAVKHPEVWGSRVADDEEVVDNATTEFINETYIKGMNRSAERQQKIEEKRKNIIQDFMDNKDKIVDIREIQDVLDTE